MNRIVAPLAATLALALGTTAFAAEHSYRVTFNDGAISPGQLQVPANQALVIEVENTGKTPAEFESHRLRQEQVIAPGETVTVRLDGLAPGEYGFVDEFHLPGARGVIVAK